MPQKSKKRRRKPVAWYQRTRYLAILLCLAGCVLFGLVWIAGQEDPVTVRSAPQQPPAVPSGPDLTEQLVAETEAFLASTPVRNSRVRRDLSSAPFRYTVDGKPPSPVLMQKFQSRLNGISTRLSAELTGDDLLVISEAGAERVLIFFVPPLAPVPTGPKIAIIMDDLGRGTHPAKVLLGIEQPVTFSILPGETHAFQVAQMAHAAKREVLLHVPMEPQGYPEKNPGDDALLIRYSEQEIARRFTDFLQKVPYAVGTNNHMGSRFTEDRRGMSAVMAELSSHGLFYVDSLTTGRSVGEEIASEYGVPALRRDVFLDNVADVERISTELHRLAKKAVQNGQAIGLCHPYPETLQALQRELPRLAQEGIQIVPVSSLLPVPTMQHPPVARDRTITGAAY